MSAKIRERLAELAGDVLEWFAEHEPAVLVEFDFERDTCHRLGLPAEHGH
jgi:hypothetical protein